MNAQKPNHNPSETLQTVTDKRLALESLINITCSVQNQHKALSEVALAARPSQQFPKKIVSYFKAIEQHMAGTDSTGLLQKLEIVEAAINRSIGKLLNLAKINVNQLRNDEINNIDIDSFKNFIDDFKRRTQTSLALRFILKKRGMAIAPFKVPLPQESIAAQIDALKEKERKCVKQIRSEIQVIIKDTQDLLLLDQLPPEIRKELENVKKAMQVNIEHLDNGGSVTEIPNVFEIITLESEPAYTSDQSSKEENSNTKSVTAETSEIESPTQPSATSVENNDGSSQQLAPASDEKKANKQPPKSFWWLLKKMVKFPVEHQLAVNQRKISR